MHPRAPPPRRCPARGACRRSPRPARIARRSARSSCTPFSLAATCALMSATFTSGLRDGYSRPASSSASVSASRKRPPSTSSKLSISTPSSSSVRANGGIEPGVMPPMSAWWPRDATKNRIVARRPRRTPGVMTVTSGRCVPPLIGIVQRHRRRRRRIVPLAARDDRPHALAHRAEMHGHVRRVGHQPALGIEDRAGEVQPLLDVDRVARCSRSRTPICSATVMNRLLNISSSTGSALGAARPPATRRDATRIEQHVIQPGHLRRPAGLDHGRRVGLEDQRPAR